MNKRRLKFFDITPELLIDIIKQCFETNLPEDTEIRHLILPYSLFVNDEQNNPLILRLVVYSKEFPVLEEGCSIPKFTPIFKKKSEK